MKRFATVLSIVAMLSVTGTASAAGTLHGTYRTKIGDNVLGGQLKGTWTIAFNNGAYTVSRGRSAVVLGKYSITKNKVSLSHETGPLSCKSTGTYTFKLTGRKLKFTRVSDSSASCAGRVAVLSGKFTKVG